MQVFVPHIEYFFSIITGSRPYYIYDPYCFIIENVLEIAFPF